MDHEAFEKTYEGIVELNAQEGPHTNILEPKFRARDQAEILEKTLSNCIKDADAGGDVILRNKAQDQLARVLMFIGNNMAETEEEKDALKHLLKAYTCIVCAIESVVYDVVKTESADLQRILQLERSMIQLNSTPTQWLLAETYADVMNSLGVFLSNRDEVKQRVGDALRVLHSVEELYEIWNAATPEPKFVDVPLDEEGNVDATKLPQDDDASRLALRRRHRMDGLHTSNLYYLAQAHQANKDIKKASKYIHLTLANQLLCRKEFSKKSWAQHVLSLSAFYTSSDDHAAAKYCLDVGEYVMPKDKPDEETLGFLRWTFGKFHRNRLKEYSEFIKAGATATDIKTAVAKFDQHTVRPSWWVDFEVPVPGPVRGLSPITNVEEAREEFKIANRNFQEALKWYPFDGCCTDHIKICQDISDLYLHLMPFETDFLRQISIQMRRVDLIKDFPVQLSLNAYCTLIRQLYFDVGDSTTELLDLRMKQRADKVGRPLLDHQINKIQEQAMNHFLAFIDTFKDRENNNQVPRRVEDDLKAPMFRALMRMARLESRRFQKTAEEEYEMIARTIKRYEAVLLFAEDNKLKDHPELGQEVKLAREMHELLPNKQKEIWRTFQKTK